MRRGAIAVAGLRAAAAAADEFANNKSGEVVVGRLLGKVALEGKSFFLVKTADGMKRLPVGDWTHAVATRSPTAPKPATDTASAPDPAWTSTVYRGKMRSVAWLSKAYAAARQQVLTHGDKYWNVYDVRPLERAKKGVGEVFEGRGKAIRVLENGHVLATMANGQRVAIDGMTLTGVIGGRAWKACLVGLETYQDEAEAGDARSVLRCKRLAKPGAALTREEFLKMLAAGVHLYSRQTCPTCKGRGYTMRESGAVPGRREKRQCRTCRGSKTLRVDMADGRAKR